MKIAILIPVFNRKETTLNCLRQLEAIDYCGNNFDVVVIDDDSTDGTEGAINVMFPVVTVLKGDGDLWWTGAINVGIEHALTKNYDAVLLLNDDMELVPDFIVELMKVVQNNDNTLVSSIKLIEHEGGKPEILTAGFNIKGKLKQIDNYLQGELYDSQKFDGVLECDVLTGASLFIPLDVVRDIGLLNFSKFPHNWGDLEYTWRASYKGYKCLVATKSHIYTEYNPNYHRTYYINSSRREYLKNLFDNKKFSYGFGFLFNKSFMHRSIASGMWLYLRGMVSLLRHIVFKLIIPKSILSNYFNHV